MLETLQKLTQMLITDKTDKLMVCLTKQVKLNQELLITTVL